MVELGHVALRVRKLERAIDSCQQAVDPGVNWSLYPGDPEGNQVELFADNPGVGWRRSSEWINVPSVPFQF